MHPIDQNAPRFFLILVFQLGTFLSIGCIILDDISNSKNRSVDPAEIFREVNIDVYLGFPRVFMFWLTPHFFVENKPPETGFPNTVTVYLVE